MKHSHKKLDPEIKAMRAIIRGIKQIPKGAEKRCLEFVIASVCKLRWIDLPIP